MSRKRVVLTLFDVIRLRVASDLHLDSYRRNEAPDLLARIFSAGPSYDVAVIAGDVANFPSLTTSLGTLFAAIPTSVPIVYVPGNHEHYESTTEADVDAAILSAASALQRKNVHLLRGASVTIEGVRFLGTTLWYDHAEPVKAILRERTWPDFRWIPYIQARLDAWNLRDEKALTENLAASDVVVTHMLPHPSCVSPKYAGDPSNVFFVNDQGPKLAHLAQQGVAAPALWLFGHTHEWIDTRVESTRLFARPMGYRKEYPERNARADLAEACSVTVEPRA